MTGNLAYADLATRPSMELPPIRTEQWAGSIPSFDLNELQTKTMKGLLRVNMLADNWDGEGSPRPSHIARYLAAELLRSLILEGMPTAFVSPTSMGGVQLEWTQNGRELEIEILPDGTLEFLTVVNGNPQDEGQTTRELVPSLARWLRDEPDQTPISVQGMTGLIRTFHRT